MIKVYLENLIRFGQLGYRMYVANERPDGSHEMWLQPQTIKSVQSGHFVSQDDAYLDDSKTAALSTFADVRSYLQAMSDAAWEIGIKPKGVEGHTDELKAVRYHLEDMRSLALKVQPKNE